MAVSDFTPQYMFTFEDMAARIASALDGKPLVKKDLKGKIYDAMLASSQPLHNKKISSKNPDILLQLTQTPKVIGCIKAMQPETILVGFKLLSDVSKNKLLKAGKDLMKKNGCDYVLANDLKDISPSSHKAVLISKSGKLRNASTKNEIAELIYQRIITRKQQALVI
jgi:phosphopantothenate-cysteine ligase